jgi:gamma-glutamyltranspeptidase/glutathione hydrolase
VKSVHPDTESQRPTLYGSRHAISAGHYLAASAGHTILENGGNAVDASVAAGIALAVLDSNEVNFAGVAPIMIRPAHARPVTIAGVGHWPMSLPADLFMREHDGQIPHGVLCTVVPAAPDAWITALRDYGTMTFGDVAGEAIRFAREGFAMYEYFAAEVTEYFDHFNRWASNREIYLPDGRPPIVGERFIQRDLADTIQYMADQERIGLRRSRLAGLQTAHDAFYIGDIAAKIVSHQRENGGYLSRDDLANYRSRYEPAAEVRWRDFTVFTCGPWTQGPVLLQALRMLERHGLAGLDRKGIAYLHLVIEVLKAAFADREFRYGDPQFIDVRLDELLSDGHADLRLAAIDRERAHPSLPEPVGAAQDALDWLPEPTTVGSAGRAPDTSYLCVIDRWGNAVSATPSDGSYEAPVVPGTGIVPSMRGVQSRPDPRHPCGVGPGRRPRLTPNPAMAVRDDGSIYTFGCPGGDMQVQAMLQVFLNTFHFGMDVQAAIDAPRFSTWSFPNSFAPFEFLAGRMALEDRYPDDLVDGLQRRGHDVERWPAFTRSASAVEAIYFDAGSRFLRAGADPRQPAYAIVS